MFHHLLNILIYGESSLLTKVMAGIEADEHLNFNIHTTTGFDPELFAEADIIIFNGPADFKAARALAKHDATLVACLTPAEEKNISPEEKNTIDDIWQAPLTEFRLQRRIDHLLAEISGRDNYAFLIGCLDTLINSLPDMVWFKDLDGVHRKVNDYFCEFVSKPREEVESRTHEEIWGVSASDNEHSCQGTDQEAIDTGETVVAEEVVETDAGKHLFKTIKTPIRGLEGEIRGTVGIAHDITNMFNLNMELDLFIQMMPFPLMICDLEDRIVKANNQFLEFFETGFATMLEVPWRDWYEDNIQHEISPTGEAIYRRFVHADGHVSFLKMISHEMNDLFGNYLGVIHVFEDVTEDKEQEYNIWKLANTDALTEIANRKAFYEYAKRINRKENIHLFYIDLDNFKQVNDLHGHKAGDEALKVTASIMRHVFNKDFPARLGGDEFIVCVRSEATLEEIKKQAQELIDNMKEQFAANEVLKLLSCSVGVLYNGHMSEGMDTLIKKADSAMYEAKKHGKACYCLYRETDEIKA